MVEEKLPPLSAASEKSAGGHVMESADHGNTAHGGLLPRNMPDQLLPSAKERPPDLKFSRLAFDAVDSHALRAVQAWWAPVEDSVRCRQVEKLTGALKVAHGGTYLKTVRKVRRSQSLRPVERHELEMEMAARLVQARSVLGKWEAGLREIHDAHKARDMERLQEVLAKWDFAESDPDVARVKQDLSRWQSLAYVLPSMLESAVKSRDVAKIKENLGQLRDGGPTHVKGLELAQKILASYSLQTKHLHKAVKSGDSRTIETQLQSWRFDEDDNAVMTARHALQKREQLKINMRIAIDARDGARLQDIIASWHFEISDPDYIEAKDLLRLHSASVLELLQSVRSNNLPLIAEALASWSFSRDDSAVLEAQQRLSAHEDSIRAALASRDGWALQHIWQASGGARALAHMTDGLREDTITAHKQYNLCVNKLRHALNALESRNNEPDSTIEELIHDWPFATSDPNLQGALSWLEWRSVVTHQSLFTLQGTLECGSIQAVQSALSRAQFLAGSENPQCIEAYRFCAAYQSALDAAGTLALGILPTELREASTRAAVLDESAARVQNAAQSISLIRLAELRLEPRVTSVVHGVLEVCMHLVAGINPSVKEPPRDTQWRSIQRMLSSIPAFISQLCYIPDWIASGHFAGIGRARSTCLRLESELGDQWSVEYISDVSHVAAQLLQYVECVLEYADLVSNDTRRAESVASGEIPLGSDGCDAWGRKMSPTPPSRPGSACAGSRPGSRGGSRAGAGGSHSIPSRDLSHAKLASVSTQCMLQQARNCIGGCEILCAGWVIVGGDTSDLHLSLDKANRLALSANAKTLVADAILKSLALRFTPPSQVEGAVKTQTSPPLSLSTSPMVSPESAPATAKLVEGPQTNEPACAADSTERDDNRPHTSDARMTAKPRSASNTKPDRSRPQTSEGCVDTKRTQSAERLPSHTPVKPAGKLAAVEKPRPLGKNRPVSKPARPIPSKTGAPEQISASVKLISGKLIAQITVDATASVNELKEQITRVEGTPPKYQQLFLGSMPLAEGIALGKQQVVNGSTLLMVRTSRSLPAMLESAIGAVSSCSVSELDAAASCEAALLLLHGNTSSSFGARSTKAVMIEILRTALDALRKEGKEALRNDGKEDNELTSTTGLWDAMSPGQRPSPQTPESPSSTAERPRPHTSEQRIPRPPTSPDQRPPRPHTSEQRFQSRPPTSPEQRPPRPQTSEQRSHRGFRAAATAARVVAGQSARSEMKETGASDTLAEEVPPHRDLCATFDPIRLTPSFVRSLQVPQTNLALACYALQNHHEDTRSANAVSEFVNVMLSFYYEFVIQRYTTIAALSCWEESEKALQRVEHSAFLASTLAKKNEAPPCDDVSGVLKAAADASDQIVTLASHGLALPAVHVEYVRQAIDGAGLHLLGTPPANEPGARLAWTEQAMNIQLAALPHFAKCLSTIASKHIDPVQLQAVSQHDSQPLTTEAVRLVSAIVWLIDPECHCNASSADAKSWLSRGDVLVQKLVAWNPVRDATPQRLARARDLLLGTWPWVTAGCSGHRGLKIIFAWASLAVVLLPMVEMAQLLIPVHRAVKRGLAKIKKASDATSAVAKSRAWTATLFLLDGQDAPWWWLQLIRPAAGMEPPWLDGEDGGLTEASRKGKDGDIDCQASALAWLGMTATPGTTQEVASPTNA